MLKMDVFRLCRFADYYSLLRWEDEKNERKTITHLNKYILRASHIIMVSLYRWHWM